MSDVNTSASHQEPYLSLNQESTSAPQTNAPANGNTFQDLKNSVLNTGSSVMENISNAPATQQAKDTIVNGPVGQSVQAEASKTSNEFSNLASARVTPDQPAATGQPLTHYHSLFYRLLSWKDPRATGILFAALVGLIFASRYLDITRWLFKALYSVLGVTVLGEFAGKAVMGDGFATKLRPNKYYTIRKESLERFLDDVEQLINFGVIEFQRIVFAENIWVTVAAFSSSFISYWLIKWLPFWGLTLLSTCVTFLTPLVYLSNKDFIDGQLNHAGNMINQQATQVRGLAVQSTNQASETLRTYAGEYSNKAQELIGNARGKANGATAKAKEQFPNAPKHEPVGTAHTSTAPVGTTSYDTLSTGTTSHDNAPVGTSSYGNASEGGQDRLYAQ